MKTKKKYIEPDVEIIRVEEDVICTSGEGDCSSEMNECPADD